MSGKELSPEDQRLRRRYDRERLARKEAEAIAERVTGELYASGAALKDLNERLEEANAVLETANQSIKEFVAIASHDMRNPLTLVLGYARTLKRKWGTLSDVQKLEFIDVIESQGVHMNRLVDDLLTVSQIEAGAVETHIEEICIARALEQTVGEFGDKGADVSIVADERIMVLMDPHHLERILVNYVGNAFKYGSPPILAEATETPGWVELRVSDNGEGVPEEFVPKLFGKFARADTESTRQQQGTGLGLSIVRGLARANGGDAWYEPHLPNGSCFAVRFKRAA